MSTAMHVADYFLASAPQGTMTHLKLQKLCAYAQAVSLGYRNRELFSDDLEAWPKGPVVKAVYEKFGHFPGIIPNALVPDLNETLKHFNSRERLVLGAVNVNLGIYEDWALSNQSHLDFPGNFDTKDIISKESLKTAFENSTLVNGLRSTDKYIPETNGRWLNEMEIDNALGV